MNDTLKQRLIGALILLALGVVFWPIIFVEPGAELSPSRQAIPPAPAIDTSQLPVPAVGDLRPSRPLTTEQDSVPDEFVPDAPVDSEDQTAEGGERVAEDDAVTERSVEPAAPVAKPSAISQPQTRTEAPVKPEIDADGVPIAWILRVASVSDEAKAEELRLRLLGIELKAYVKKIKRGDEALYRVYIGPKFEKAKLEGIQPQINREFGVETMITRYIP